MAVIDIVFLVVIAISCIMGIFSGLIKEAFSLLTWIGALVIGSMFYPPVADILNGLIDNTSLRNLSAFAIIFVITILIGTLAGNFQQKLIHAAGLGGVDRVLGALFGFLRGIVIISLVLLVTVEFDFTANWYEGSFMVPHLMVIVDFLKSLIQGNEVNTEEAAEIAAFFISRPDTIFLRS